MKFLLLISALLVITACSTVTVGNKKYTVMGKPETIQPFKEVWSGVKIGNVQFGFREDGVVIWRIAPKKKEENK